MSYTIKAAELFAGCKIYDVQVEGERIVRKTPKPIQRTYKHGPCITVETARGAVEYDQDEHVTVTAATYRLYESFKYMQAAMTAHGDVMPWDRRANQEQD